MKSLFKTTIITLSTVALYTFSGCKSDGYSYLQLRNTKPTHTIQSLDLESKIKTVLTDKKNFEELESEVILLFIQKIRKIMKSAYPELTMILLKIIGLIYIMT